MTLSSAPPSPSLHPLSCAFSRRCSRFHRSLAVLYTIHSHPPSSLSSSIHSLLHLDHQTIASRRSAAQTRWHQRMLSLSLSRVGLHSDWRCTVTVGAKNVRPELQTLLGTIESNIRTKSRSPRLQVGRSRSPGLRVALVVLLMSVPSKLLIPQ